MDIDTMLARYSDVWPTEASFRNWVRGGLRRGLWNKHPVKLRFMNRNRFKAPRGRPTKKAPEGTMVWCCTCAGCNETQRTGECQVDHKEGENPFHTLGGLQEYVLRQILVTEDDLQWMCKRCHDLKTYAERYCGGDLGKARREKRVVAFKHLKADAQRATLQEGGEIQPGPTQKDRVDQYRKLLEKLDEC